MDVKGDTNLDVDDFRWGLMDFGITVTKDEAAEVLKYFDKDVNGMVNFEEFVKTLKVSYTKLFNLL
jgi:Ca2+-binding EF-hand superfamily protein